MRNTRPTATRILLLIVAQQQHATSTTNMILAVKEKSANTSLQQCLRQMQLVVFSLQLTLLSPIIMARFSISDAAKRAGVERTTLYRKLNKGEDFSGNRRTRE
jgi:DNA-binding phage protein